MAQERASSRKPVEHVYVTYVVAPWHNKYERRVFTDYQEAQDFYSAESAANHYPSWEKVHKGIECYRTRKDELSSQNCPHHDTATYTITRWVDEIGNELIRCHIILPNDIPDRKANRMLLEMAKQYARSTGKTLSGWITGGASVNVTPGMTEWNLVYSAKKWGK